MNEYNNLTHFIFWCQKVLPLVYDDSLSYYEILCKVVDYINKLIDDDKWSMSVFLSRNIHVKKEGKNSLLIGEDIWQKYKKLLMNGTMDYSEKQVKLSEVRSLMNYFIYEIKRNENLVYDDKIGELYFIRNGDNYFNNNKLNKEKLEHEGELFINI